jgi:prepilin-type N-terminal cleavage/methylation domain-containing protein
MKSPSRSPGSPGFTLLEILVAAAIGLVVVGFALEAYFAAQKAKAVAVGGSLLKAAGQATLDDIYKGVHQSKHLYVRGDAADTLLARLPMHPFYEDAGALSPGPTKEELRLPDLKLTGSFQATDPNFDPDAAGNALFFARSEPNATADAAGLQAALGTSRLALPAYTLDFYCLVRRPLPPGQFVRGTDRYTYGLMHYRSKPYLDYHELVDFQRSLKRQAADADGTIDEVLAQLKAGYAGAIALDVADGNHAIFDLAATHDHLDLYENATARIATGSYRTPLAFAMNQAFGEPMVAFNTTAEDPSHALPVAGLDVPAFAPDKTTFPYGLETMVAGPPDARQVLVRLALAAKTQPGRTMVASSHQQIVQAYDF